MSETHLYQLRPRGQSRSAAETGFTPIAAVDREHSDWGGYGPIKRFLLGTTLEEESYYGFLPPDFQPLTGLDAAAVRGLIEPRAGAADVISVSPFFDQMALYLNIVEQTLGSCARGHEAIRECAALVAPEFRVDRDVMTSLDTIFRNCFVAKPAFWAEWLRHAELISGRARDAGTSLGRALHGAASAPTEAALLESLVMDQVASLILWSQPQWIVSACDPMRLPLSRAPIAALIGMADLIVLDALKIAYARSGADQYLATFQQLRNRIAERLASTRAARNG